MSFLCMVSNYDQNTNYEDYYQSQLYRKEELFKEDDRIQKKIKYIKKN